MIESKNAQGQGVLIFIYMKTLTAVIAFNSVTTATR